MTDEDLAKAVEAVKGKVEGMDAFDSKIRFDFDDGTTLYVDGSNEPPSVEGNGEGDADCTITASAEVFQELLDGDLNPTSAYMTGKIKIDGDLSAAMNVAKVFA